MSISKWKSKVISSNVTLLVVAAFAFVVWLSRYGLGVLSLANLVGICLLAFVSTVVSGKHSLSRGKHVLSPVVFLLFVTILPSGQLSWQSLVAAFCFLLALHLLLLTYGRANAVGETFYSFLCIGIGSLFFPPLLLLAFSFAVSMFIQLHSLQTRTFFAGLLGVLLPFCGYFVYCVYDHSAAKSLTPFTRLFVSRGDLSSLTAAEWAAVAWLVVLPLLAFLARITVQSGYKRQTRSLLYALLLQTALLGGLQVWQPQCCALLLLALTGALIVVHYFSFVRNRVSNALFILLIAGSLLLTLYSLWSLS